MGRKRGGVTKKTKRGGGNALAHLEKFSSLQMVSVLCPDEPVDITVEQIQQNFRASTTFRGTKITALQQSKKKAKQALCTKLIKTFKLLDPHRGEGLYTIDCWFEPQSDHSFLFDF